MADVQTQASQQIVEITEAAANKARAVIESDPQMQGIRVGVLGGGCAGLQYDLHPEAEPKEGDLIQEAYGVKFFIHPMVIPYLKGTIIDFSDSLMEGGFKFRNPNAASSCGCGTSFGV